jgi:hypothetical protein
VRCAEKTAEYRESAVLKAGNAGIVPESIGF